MPLAQENLGGTTQCTLMGRMGEAFLQTTKAGKVAWLCAIVEMPPGKSVETPPPGGVVLAVLGLGSR
jgi:hypothetical protein